MTRAKPALSENVDSDPDPEPDRDQNRVSGTVRLAKRSVPVLALLGAVGLVGGILVAAAGASPSTALQELLKGAAGDRYRIAETLVRAIPLALVALGVAFALRARVFTVGSEGQLVAGALVSTAVLTTNPTLPALPALVLGLICGAVGGMLWALVPAILRARGRVNEILSTLLFNYLAASLLSWSLRTWLRNPDAVATLQSRAITETARVPLLLPGTRLHWGVGIVVVAAVGLGFWIRTPMGFGFDLHGERPAVAARMGISQARAVLVTMLVSGGAAGIAGWLQVAGTTGRLYTSVAGGLGFAGLAVAVVGRLRPIGVCVAAVVFAALSTGSDSLQAGTQIPASFSHVLQALLLLSGAVGAVVLARKERTIG